MITSGSGNGIAHPFSYAGLISNNYLSSLAKTSKWIHGIVEATNELNAQKRLRNEYMRWVATSVMEDIDQSNDYNSYQEAIALLEYGFLNIKWWSQFIHVDWLYPPVSYFWPADLIVVTWSR